MAIYKNFNQNLKVFLGGTCKGSKWRDDLIPKLNIRYFNPVVEEWTEECKIREIREREECDFCLYTITPLMTGVYSIFEVADDSNKRPHKTIFCLLEKDNGEKFNKQQLNSLKEVANGVVRNGGKVFFNLNDVAEYLNNGGVYNE